MTKLLAIFTVFSALVFAQITTLPGPSGSGGGGTSSGTTVPLVTGTTPGSTLTWGTGGVSFGSTNCTFGTSPTATIVSGSGSTTVRFWVDSACHRVVNYDAAVLTSVTLGSGLTADTTSTAFPVDVQPVATAPATNTNFTSLASIPYQKVNTLTVTGPLVRTDTPTGPNLSCPTCGSGGAPYSPADTIFDFDDLVGANATGSNAKIPMSLTVASGTVANLNSEANHVGLGRLTANGSSTVNYTSVLSSGVGVQFLLNVTNLRFSSIFRINSTAATAQYRIGYFSTPWIAQTIDGIYLEKAADSNTNWFCVSRAGDVQTRVDTGVALGTGWVVGEVKRIDSTHVGCRIASTWTAMQAASYTQVTTNLPGATLAAYGYHASSTDATAVTMDVDYYEYFTTVTR